MQWLRISSLMLGLFVVCTAGSAQQPSFGPVDARSSEGVLWSRATPKDLSKTASLHSRYRSRADFKRTASDPVAKRVIKTPRLPELPRVWAEEDEWEDQDQLQQRYEEERHTSPQARRRAYAAVAAQNPQVKSNSYAPWQPVGGGIYRGEHAPYSMAGRVSAAQYAYDNAQSLTVLWVAGAAGGLWKAARAGSGFAWVLVSGAMPDPTVGAFLVDRTDSRQLFIGTGNQGRSVGSGLYRSADAGATWHAVPMSPLPQAFYKIAQDRGNADVLLAASDTGLYRSDTHGLAWARIYTGDVTDLVQDPQTPNYWYAGVRGVGVLESSTGGISFHPIDGDGGAAGGLSGSVGRIALAQCESVPNYIYALVGDNANRLEGVYRSQDYGHHWDSIRGEDRISLSAAHHAFAIAVDPSDPDRVAIGITYAEMTANATESAPDWSIPYASGHPDFTSLLFIPQSVAPGNTQLIATNDGGIYVTDYTTNNMDDSLNTLGLNIEEQQSQFGSMAGSRSDPDILIAGLQDNGIVRIDSSAPHQVLSRMAGTDGGQVSISTDSSDRLYASVGTPYVRVYSPDAGNNWFPVFAPTNEEAPPLHADPRPGLIGPKVFTYLASASPVVYAQQNLNTAPLTANETLTVTINGTDMAVSLLAGDHTDTAVSRISTAIASAGFDRIAYAAPGAGYFGVGLYVRGGDQTIRVASNRGTGPGTTGFGTAGIFAAGRFGGLWYQPATSEVPAWLPVAIDPELSRESSVHFFIDQAMNPFYDVFYVSGLNSQLFVYDSQVDGPVGSMTGHEVRTPPLAPLVSVANDGRAYADRSSRQWDTVYYTTVGRRPSQAFLSTNRGGVWTEVTGNLAELAPEADYVELVGNPANLNELFLATSVGVFYSRDRGTTWESFNQGLPAVTQVQTIVLQFDNALEPKLYIGTQGQGFWSRSLSDVIFGDSFD